MNQLNYHRLHSEERFSNYIQMLRVLTYCRRFIHNYRNRSSKYLNNCLIAKAALKRLTVRSGKVFDIYCNNVTNFRGATHVLNKLSKFFQNQTNKYICKF